MARKQSETQQAIDALIREYLIQKGTPYIEGNPAMGIVYRRLLRPAKEILKAADGDRTIGITRIREIKRWADSANLSWSLETVIKRWFENNHPKAAPVFTNEKWKDELEEKTEEQTIKVEKGVESLRDILEKKGIIKKQKE